LAAFAGKAKRKDRKQDAILLPVFLLFDDIKSKRAAVFIAPVDADHKALAFAQVE